MTAPFVLFGPAHLGALGATALVAASVAWVMRRAPEGRATRLRHGLAALLLALTAAYLGAEAVAGNLTTWHVVPLQLCDLAIFLGAYALWTRRPLACEVLYFWACAGTVLAMVTPDLGTGFPHWRFLSYFALHGGVVVAALAVTLGLGIRPAPGAPWRVFLITNAYAALVGAVNAVFGTNFLYLCRKPYAPTPLDWFGPWPLYIIAGEGIALALFGLLHLPFWASRRRALPLPPSVPR